MKFDYHMDREFATEQLMASATRGDLEAMLRHRTKEGHALRRRVTSLRNEVRRLNQHARNLQHAEMRMREKNEEINLIKYVYQENLTREMEVRKTLEAKVKDLEKQVATLQKEAKELVESRS